MTLAVADTGVLVAAAAEKDRDHLQSVEAVERNRRGGIVVPSTVAVEVDYLLKTRVGTPAARAFLADVHARRYIWEGVDERAMARSIEIDERYADLDLGLVDCSVVAVAEALHATTILTLDIAHFSICASEFRLEP